MQKAHELSQPIWIVTQASYEVTRLAGNADGNIAWSSSTASSKISVSGPSTREVSRSSAARCTLCVPITTSTQGARFCTMSRSFWAKQPETTICRPSRASFQRFNIPRLPYNLLSAFSRIQHVFNTTTSASSSSSTAHKPSASSKPEIRSESWSFIWHPKVRTTYERGS